MERIVEQTLLYDFYGELLTQRQKSIYEAVVFEDMSYSEIAAQEGISRQGVYDLIKRCDHILEEYEKKLHLLQKFLKAKEGVAKINALARQYQSDHDEKTVEQIIRIADEILADS